jgi:micrococcal nuclease
LKRIFSTAFFLFLCLLGFSQSFSGTIIRVIDGDTYTFQTEFGSFIVRMQGTDAPERDQPYSKESADFLKQYLNNDAITKVNGTDRYGRRLGTLFIKDEDINLLSIKGGYAWHFKRYSSDQEYASAELYARKYKLGLWNLPNPVPPWNWRKMN